MKKPDWKCVFTYVQSFYRRFRFGRDKPSPTKTLFIERPRGDADKTVRRDRVTRLILLFIMNHIWATVKVPKRKKRTYVFANMMAENVYNVQGQPSGNFYFINLEHGLKLWPNSGSRSLKERWRVALLTKPRRAEIPSATASCSSAATVATSCWSARVACRPATGPGNYEIVICLVH